MHLFVGKVKVDKPIKYCCILLRQSPVIAATGKVKTADFLCFPFALLARQGEDLSGQGGRLTAPPIQAFQILVDLDSKSQGSHDSFGFVPFRAHVRFGVFDSRALNRRTIRAFRFAAGSLPRPGSFQFVSMGLWGPLVASSNLWVRPLRASSNLSRAALPAFTEPVVPPTIGSLGALLKQLVSRSRVLMRSS